MSEGQPERTLGSYRLIERVGVGGMGVVYRARHQRLGRQAAVKVLPEVLASDPKFLRRFEREATNAAALQHPNILAVWEFGEENGVPYLVMPYITGGTLRQRLLNGPLSPQMALTYLRQIAEALDYAHRQGIIHRDVKPANLLIDERGRLYLADFGIAKALEGTEGLTHTGVGVGTVEYMAPEQAQGEADARSDLYALGIILYEMLVGRVPYSGKSNVEILLKHLQAPLPLIPLREAQPDLPPAIEAVLTRALAKQPGDRYQSGKELADALAEAIGEGAVPDYPTMTGITFQPNHNPPTLESQNRSYSRLSPLAATNLDAGAQYPAPYRATPTPPTLPSRPTPAPPTQTPLPVASGRTPAQATPLPYHTPLPPASGMGAVAAQPARNSGRLLIGAFVAAAAALLVLLVGIGALVLFRPSTPTPARGDAPATSTTAPGISAGLGPTTAPQPSPAVPGAAASPSPNGSAGATLPAASGLPAALASPTPPPATATATPAATRTTVPAPLPRGTAPSGWKTYSGNAKVPFAIYYPPDWTIDEQAADSGQIYLRPPTGGSIWMMIATNGQPDPNNNIDVLRAQYYDTGLTDCLQKAIDKTNYPEFSGMTFAGLGATCETASGLNYARIGLGLRGQVAWVYRLNAPYGQYTDLLNRYFQSMLNSLNIYANP